MNWIDPGGSEITDFGQRSNKIVADDLALDRSDGSETTESAPRSSDINVVEPGPSKNGETASIVDDVEPENKLQVLCLAPPKPQASWKILESIFVIHITTVDGNTPGS